MSWVAETKTYNPHPVAILWRALVAVLLFVFGALILGVFWLASVVKLAVIRAWVGAIQGCSLELLSPMDTLLLLMKPERFTDPLCPMIIMLATTIKGAINLGRIRQKVQERLLNVREDSGVKKFHTLTKRVVQKYGYYVWEEDMDFSLDNHVRLHTESYTDDASLVQLMQALQPVPLLKHRPLWEFLLVPKNVHEQPAGEEEYTLILRIHHSMADGIYITLMMTEMCDQDSSTLLPDFKKAIERKQPKLLKTNTFLRYMVMSKSTQMTLKNVINIAVNLLEILVMIPWYAAEIMFYTTEKNALSLSSPVLSGRKLMGISEKLDLHLFKDIAHGNHCTVNDVLLRCVTEAIRRINAEVPVAMDNSVRVMLPMLILPPSPSMRNAFGTCNVTLPLQDSSSSLGCLKSISNICQNVKTSLEPLCQRFTFSAMANCLPPSVVVHLVSQLTFTMVVSNLCGPTTRVSFIGEDVVDTFFMPPSTGVCGVTFGFLSFNDKVRISVMVDRMVAPNDNIASQLIKYTAEELKNLHEATKRTQ